MVNLSPLIFKTSTPHFLKEIQNLSTPQELGRRCYPPFTTPLPPPPSKSPTPCHTPNPYNGQILTYYCTVYDKYSVITKLNFIQET